MVSGGISTNPTPSTSKASGTSNRYQLHEIMELLGEDGSIEDIVLIPPDDGDITEEESGDEAETDMNYLPPRLLRSNVEITFHSPTNEEVNDHANGVANSFPPAAKKPKKQMPTRNWSSNIDLFVNKRGKGDVEETTFVNTNLSHKSTVECFELLFTNDIIQLICEMSKGYALQRNQTVGVDRFDENVQSLRIGLQGNKMVLFSKN